MKESVLDVLMYLFETYIDTDEEPEPDRNVLRAELERAGFHDREIDRALEWLDGLSEQRDGAAERAPADRSIRLFNRRERARLDSDSQGYLMYLEQATILTPGQRELVLDRLMALGDDDIDIEQIKWVVLMVLFSQPGQETAFARMEDLVFEERTGVVH